MAEEQCIFCKISRGEISSKRIYENENFFAIRDVNPKTKGHSLIISKKHFENILVMPQTLGTELIDAIKKTSLIVMKENNCDGFNVVQNNAESAGQVVKHFHVHILPRKKKDGFNLFN